MVMIQTPSPTLCHRRAWLDDGAIGAGSQSKALPAAACGRIPQWVRLSVWGFDRGGGDGKHRNLDRKEGHAVRCGDSMMV